jgi:SRSO17 transposase
MTGLRSDPYSSFPFHCYFYSRSNSTAYLVTSSDRDFNTQGPAGPSFQHLMSGGPSMTPDDVRAAAEQLVDFHERFAPLFGKDQAQDHAYDYLKGLLVCPERKSTEPIALLVGHGDVSGLQKFVGAAPWAYDDVMAEAQALFADELVPSATGSPVGVVGVIDGSAFSKKGSHSAGVARQHNGRLGKEANCVRQESLGKGEAM